jgi:hypothetical protein
VLFTYATEEFSGKPEFSGYKEFMGQEFYYSDKRPEQLYTDLKRQGFLIETPHYRDIGGEVFLWVTAGKSE